MRAVLIAKIHIHRTYGGGGGGIYRMSLYSVIDNSRTCPTQSAQSHI